MSRPIYAQRPSKDVVRQMFVQMMSRLNKVDELRNYQYVGFGALEFIDFDLVHRRLEINDMISIEQDSAHGDRYEANKPYQCIQIVPDSSLNALPHIDWSRLSIVWLDYECALVEDVFTDVGYLGAKLIPGSALAITLNAEPGHLDDRLTRLRANVTAQRVPQGYDDDTLGSWGWATAQQRLLFATLRRETQRRSDAAVWRPIMNVRYRDDARMQMYVGVIGSPGLNNLLHSCHFQDASYYSDGLDATVIDVPYLTEHEQSTIRKKLPRKKYQRLSLPGVDPERLKQYTDVYQWIS